MVLQSLTGAERRVRLSEWPLWSTWESRLSNALPGSMAAYSAPSGVFDELEWVSGFDASVHTSEGQQGRGHRLR